MASLFALGTLAAHAQDARQVAIDLLPSAAVDDVLVTLGQIARISGGTESMRNRIGKLDVTEFKIGDEHRLVSAEQVRIRLMLADFDAEQFRLGGAKRSLIVESEEPVSARKLLAAAQRALLASYPGGPKRLAVNPEAGVAIPDVNVPRDAVTRFEASVRPSSTWNGRMRVDVAILANGKTRAFAPVYFEVREIDPSGPGVRNSGIQQTANWTSAPPGKDCLIKAHDNVKIVALVGSTRIEAAGEAQQDGNVGQVIRVRNVDSSRIVHGRIDASGAVVVEP